MPSENSIRDTICDLARSLFERGLTHGSSGNISVRLEDGGLLVTPTGSSFGRLEPNRLSRFDAAGRLVSGDAPTKEMPLHQAFYETRSQAGAVVHLHSCHAVAWSMMPGIDPNDLLPPLTAYSVMQLGRVALLPFFVPGDPATGAAIRGVAARRSAVVLANHGPVVAGRSLESAVNAIEELEATARLAILTHGRSPRALSPDQIGQVVKAFDVEWD